MPKVHIELTGPQYTFKYKWRLVVNGVFVADSFAATRWGCKYAARKAYRKVERKDASKQTSWVEDLYKQQRGEVGHP